MIGAGINAAITGFFAGVHLALPDDLAIAQAEANAKVEVAQREGDASVEVARTKAIADTNAADAVSADELTAAGWWKWVLVLASAYRKSLRSVLTTVVGGFALYLNYKLAMQFDAFDLLPLLTFSAIAWFAAGFGQVFKRSLSAQRVLNRIASVVFVGLALRLATAER